MSNQHKQLPWRLAFFTGLVCSLILLLQPGTSFSAPIDEANSSSAPMAAKSTMEIVWSTVDNGGQTSSNGSLALSGTIGQPDAGVLAASSYLLVGGFWSGARAFQSGFGLYLPVIVR